MILLFIIIVAIATGLTTVFGESFHRFSEITRVENAADTVSEVAATTFARSYIQQKKACVLEELTVLPVCTKLPDINSCIEKKAISCGDEFDDCITAAEVECSSHSDEFKAVAQSEAESASAGVSQKMAGAPSTLTFYDSGEVEVSLTKAYTPLLGIGTSGEITRSSKSQSFSIGTK